MNNAIKNKQIKEVKKIERSISSHLNRFVGHKRRYNEERINVSPSSQSPTLTDEYIPTISELVKDLNIEKLIEYLKQREFEILRKKDITDFIESLKPRGLRAFSSYNSFKGFKDVLKQFKINGSTINDIKQLTLERCVDDLSTLFADDNEAKRREFIIIHIVKRITNEKVTTPSEFG
ncbi:13839_t:CDS:2 [Funneliformis geosporum]|uniref:13839_t:CDS:1 n=1 Tax=Funneliformis geosporum TaxID=1117311 RepID=A0A9W4WSJ9_9GLOM|nr:13839_t:CDS:2 [Funneliformis geosporum]